MTYLSSEAGRHSWECFQELLADGKPHRLNEIAAYAAEKAHEKGIEGSFHSKNVWMAIHKKVRAAEAEYGHPAFGFYQLRSAMGDQADAPPRARNQKQAISAAVSPAEAKAAGWYEALDIACDLEKLLQTGFGQEEPLPQMTAVDWQVYLASGNAAKENIDQVVNHLSYWLAQMEDHYAGVDQGQDEEYEEIKASMDKDAYYAELARRLSGHGLLTQRQAGALEVILDTLPACVVSPDGAVWKRPGDAHSEAEHEAYRLAAREAQQVREYLNAIGSAPPLPARGLEEPCKQLADFNGYVLAARETGRGPEFITWQWSYDRSYVTLGHYYGDDYQNAKQDFACRAGLVDPNRIFNNEQLTGLYNQLRYSLDEGMIEFGPAAEKQLEGIIDQIKNVLPNVGEQYQQQLAQVDAPEMSMT